MSGAPKHIQPYWFVRCKHCEFANLQYELMQTVTSPGSRANIFKAFFSLPKTGDHHIGILV